MTKTYRYHAPLDPNARMDTLERRLEELEEKFEGLRTSISRILQRLGM